MTVYELLKEDHEEAKKLLEQLDETTERAIKTRESVFAELDAALELHMYRV
jgi:hypothetical protein